MEYLTVKEAANVLNLSARTVRRWVRSGKLPAVKVGRSWRILASDVLPERPERRAEGQNGRADLVALIDRLTRENVQLAGQVGFLQARVRLLEAPKPLPWWRRLWPGKRSR